MSTVLCILISIGVIFILGPHIVSPTWRTIASWGFGIIGILSFSETGRKWIFPIACIVVAVLVSPYVDSLELQLITRWGLGGIGIIILIASLRPILAEKRRVWAREASWKAEEGAKKKVKELAAKRDIKGLSRSLSNRKYDSVRRAAAEALGQIGDAGAVAPLTAALHDRDNYVRRNSVEALAKMGIAAFTPLVGVLKDKDSYVRQAAAKALGQIGDSRAIVPLSGALKDSDGGVRLNSAEAMAKMGPAAIAPLASALKDNTNSSYVRKTAAKALGQIGDSLAVASLTEALHDNSVDVQQAAVDALDKLLWQPDRSEAGAIYWVTKRQWDQCVNIGGTAVKPLIAILTDSSKSNRQAAAGALVQIYKSGSLNEAHKLLILNQRDKITQKHEDGDQHSDYSESRSSDCDYHSDSRGHVDTGIGINFPA